MSKVILPKSVAEAIETMRSKGVSNYGIIDNSSRYPTSRSEETVWRWAFGESRTGNPDLLMSALVNGYEIEKSPEEKLREYYEDHVKDEISGDYDRKFTGEATTKAIVDTLDILGITIEGIND